ncbi:hypothetical protein BC828DRAFT_391499 [Blastocladiella britannica]|nr:hypothetical protein BC828DRAFT_391499 [Blastocladiella britannica]
MSSAAHLLVSRMAGLITSGPSLLTTMSLVNCVASRYQGRPLQNAILAAAGISVITDILILVGVGSWFVDSTWTGWVPAILAINTLKRAHSVVTAHMLYLRMTAMIREFAPIKNKGHLFTATYLLISLMSVGFQWNAYAESNWNAAVARQHPSFVYGYRICTLVCVFMYVIPAIGTDLHFLIRHRVTHAMAKRFSSVKMFYNPNFYTCLEMVMAFSVAVPLVLGMVQPAVDWTSSVYTEQFLLSVIGLNSALSIKAATMMPGDNTNTTSDDKSASRGGGGVTTGGGGTSAGVGPRGSISLANVGSSSLAASANQLSAFGPGQQARMVAIAPTAVGAARRPSYDDVEGSGGSRVSVAFVSNPRATSTDVLMTTKSKGGGTRG